MRIRFIQHLVLFMAFLGMLPVQAAENKITTGMELPDIVLEGTDCRDMAAYLGVENRDIYMDLSKIPAKVMILEFFAVTCPVCQTQAPVANKIYKIIQRNPELKDDVKMFAIGIGARQDDANAYREQYAVKFPLFIDPYRKSEKRHGISKIPYTMVIGADRKVLLTHLGVIENTDEFIAKITEFKNQR